MYIIDLKDRTVAKFTEGELMTFVSNYKKLEKSRFWIVKTRTRAVKLIKQLIKEGF